MQLRIEKVKTTITFSSAVILLQDFASVLPRICCKNTYMLWLYFNEMFFVYWFLFASFWSCWHITGLLLALKFHNLLWATRRRYSLERILVKWISYRYWATWTYRLIPTIGWIFTSGNRSVLHRFRALH